MFRDFSKIDEETDPSDLDCGILARLFPRDLFIQVTDSKKEVFKVSLDNVADKSFVKLFALKPELSDLQNPLFANWMVTSLEKQHSGSIQKVVGKNSHKTDLEGTLQTVALEHIRWY